MIELSFKHMDWTLIRQALALGLRAHRRVTIKGGSDYICGNSTAGNLFREIESFCTEHEAGVFGQGGRDIIFEPGRIKAGTLNIQTGNLSSVIDLLLFIMPALFSRDFRCVINLQGVTHSSISISPSLMKETFLPLLEQCGLYGSLLVRRFGFYGTGGGGIEARIYPAEPSPSSLFDGSVEPCINGARIFSSRTGMEIASQQKALLAQGLSIPDDRVSIIEILDSDGPGNAVQVSIGYGERVIVFDRITDFYNDAGDLIFEKEGLPAEVEGLVRETTAFLSDMVMPSKLIRELVPYCRMTGSLFGVSCGSYEDTDYICSRLL